MTGIDKITAEILMDAQSRADEILDQARKDADDQLAAAAAEAAEASEAAGKKAERAVSDYEDRVRSQCEQEKKLAYLAAKQEVIDKVMTEAAARVKNQEPAAYYETLEKIMAANVRAGEGEILLSAADKARVPESFLAKAKEIAANAGGSLALAEEVADIDGGFILRYGQIEENCSLSALFAENRDRLQDTISSILW